ncbi:hypothetical protein BDZ88DRAFT_509331 [Geranomyces variabilis]|nr:hypothetical protein BDZ88DRAFT_509331 [Geranomyces variabilis]KAJ3132496.1 hypothetical protein HDU90_006857 [Geranomyces variabilis]
MVAFRRPRSLLAALPFLFLLLLLIAPAPARAWEKEDLALFDLNDALKAAANTNDVDFYSVLNVSRTATSGEIQQAYRAISRSLHPDKNPDEGAQKLYQVLTSVITVLKTPEQRERYDGHLRNGIPTWRGAGYFYDHYKPGIPDIIVILIVATSFVQYVSAWLIYWRRGSAVSEAQSTVNNLTYQQVKKQLKKRGAESGSSPALSRKAFKNATPLQLLGESGELPEHLVRTPPRLKDVLLVRLPVWAVRFVIELPARIMGRGGNTARDEAAGEDDTVATASGRSSAAGTPDDSPRNSGSEHDDSGSDRRALRARRKKAPAAGGAIKTGPWELQEIKNLVDATKRIPPNSAQRWVRIADELQRTVADVQAKAKEIGNNPKLVLQG